MARIRTVKPEFFTSEDIVSLSPWARLLYIATWCEADRDGRMTWKPLTMKLRYFPADNIDINVLCKELIDAGLVILYGEGLAYIPKFARHQHINPRETQSDLPAPKGYPQQSALDSSAKEGYQQHAANDVDETTRHDASPRVSDVQGGRKEGKEGNTRRRRVDDDALPDGFEGFWSAYPNKRAKQDAAKAWRKLAPNEALQTSILKAVAEQSQGGDWRKEGGRFVPHAATWLNGERWTDSATVTPAFADIFAGAR